MPSRARLRRAELPPRTRLGRIALLLLTTLLAAGCARIAGEPFQPTHNAALPLEGQASLGQTFQSPSGAVAGVDLLVATYGTAPAPDAALRVGLLEEPGGAVLAEAEIPGSDLEDNTWVGATFEQPVPVGDAAALEVRWDGPSPVAVRANVPPPDHTPDLLLNDPYPGGELLRDGQRATGDLAFRVRGDPGAGDVLAALVGLARGFVGGLVRDPLFAIGWLALVGGALALAVLGWRRRPAAVAELDEGGEDEQRHRDREGAADQP